jgi:hypothetical protein
MPLGREPCREIRKERPNPRRRYVNEANTVYALPFVLQIIGWRTWGICANARDRQGIE